MAALRSCCVRRTRAGEAGEAVASAAFDMAWINIPHALHLPLPFRLSLRPQRPTHRWSAPQPHSCANAELSGGSRQPRGSCASETLRGHDICSPCAKSRASRASRGASPSHSRPPSRPSRGPPTPSRPSRLPLRSDRPDPDPRGPRSPPHPGSRGPSRRSVVGRRAGAHPVPVSRLHHRLSERREGRGAEASRPRRGPARSSTPSGATRTSSTPTFRSRSRRRR